MAQNRYKIISISQLKIMVLLVLIITTSAIHFEALLYTYQSVENIRSENPSGSTLAERYLILGDWPASRTNNLNNFTLNYQILKSSKEPTISKADE